MSEKSKNDWIGVDLDGTLAYYDNWVAWNVIGDPIKPMVDRIRNWINLGYEVRIFTARVAYASDFCFVTKQPFTRDMIIEEIHRWLRERADLPILAVTAVKDFKMIELWDDRCVQVIPNTGMTIAEEAISTRIALSGKP